jgi:hypothetical protein
MCFIKSKRAWKKHRAGLLLNAKSYIVIVDMFGIFLNLLYIFAANSAKADSSEPTKAK